MPQRNSVTAREYSANRTTQVAVPTADFRAAYRYPADPYARNAAPRHASAVQKYPKKEASTHAIPLKILSILPTILVIAAVVLAVALVGARIVGLDVRTVVSGSMEPVYRTGSVIWVKPCEAEEVQVGDVITFVLNENLDVATHRVVDVDAQNRRFTTKGDANDAPDAAPVLFENLIGKPVASVPKLGYFVSYVQHPPGLYVAVAAAALLLLLVFLPDLLFRGRKEPEPLQRPAGTQYRASDAQRPAGTQYRAPSAQRPAARGGGRHRT